MHKLEAVDILEKAYPDLKVYSIIEEPDMFIAQMTRKNGDSILGGTKGVYIDSGEVTEVSPLKNKGLLTKLMRKSAIFKLPRIKE